MEMDAVTAHLDRGWDLLNRGELAAARVSAQHIFELDDESPEGHALLGAITAAEGDADEALELFRRALDADPDYLDAMLYAADLAIHASADIDYALSLCDEAEEVIGGSGDEMLDIWLLRGEAHVAAGSPEKARRAADALPPPPYPDITYSLRVGRLLLETAKSAEAIELLSKASECEATGLDARYYLGVAYEMEGRTAEAMEQFVTVHRAESEQASAFDLSLSDFEASVRAVIEGLGEPLDELVCGEAKPVIHVSHYPPLELVVEGFDPRAPVFFAGIPAEPPEGPSRGGRRRRRRHSTAELYGIFVYQLNVERFARGADGVAGEVYRSLVHEAAHFFALDDEQCVSLLEDLS